MLKAKAIALAHGGAFVCQELGQQEPRSSKKLFVREVVPGEVILVEPTTEHKNFTEAKQLEVLEPSAHRVIPPCRYFSRCGGCDLQHIEGAYQRELKLEMVKSALLRQAKIEPRLGFELLGAKLPYFHYRSRVTLHLSLAGELGFFEQGSRQLVPIVECLLADALLNATLKALSLFTSQLAPLAALIGLEKEEQGCFVIIYLREERRFEELGSLPFFSELKSAFPKLKIFEQKKPVFSQPAQALGCGHFSQVNPEANQELVRAVLRAITENEVTELFAGAGNFSLPLARAGKLVTAVELEGELVKLGEHLAAQESLAGRIEFVRSSAEAFARKTAAQKGCLLLDPPRSGAKFVLEKLKPGAYNHIVYVSCSLPTLTRDLKTLLSLGYQLEKVEVLDMFPQTHHVETVSSLRAT